MRQVRCGQLEDLERLSDILQTVGAQIDQ